MDSSRQNRDTLSLNSLRMDDMMLMVDGRLLKLVAIVEDDSELSYRMVISVTGGVGSFGRGLLSICGVGVVAWRTWGRLFCCWSRFLLRERWECEDDFRVDP